jgi:hypothetical protein
LILRGPPARCDELPARARRAPEAFLPDLITMPAAARLDAVLRGEIVAWSSLETSSSDLLCVCNLLEISGLVHHRLAHSASLQDWPETVRQELARRAWGATAAALVRASECTVVLDALAAAGIQPILLKGVPLAHAIYAAPGMRAHADTDLLVRRDQIERVKSVLSGLGYVEPPFSDGELLFCQFHMFKEGHLGVDHVFDVHWKISTQSVFADVLAYDELAAATEPVPALGQNARAAGGMDALLLACIHPVMHHRNADRLIWLYDIHLLASRLTDVDLERFAASAVRKQVAAICLHQLLLAQSRFGTRVPGELIATLSSPGPAEPSATYLKAGRRWHDELVSNVTGLGGWRDRLRLLREVILPGSDYMLAAYGVGRTGTVLLPVLYVHRCVRGAWRVMSGRK